MIGRFEWTKQILSHLEGFLQVYQEETQISSKCDNITAVPPVPFNNYILSMKVKTLGSQESVSMPTTVADNAAALFDYEENKVVAINEQESKSSLGEMLMRIRVPRLSSVDQMNLLAIADTLEHVCY